MFDLTDAELLVLGIAGWVGACLTVVETPIVLSVRLICFVVSLVLFLIAVIWMVTN